MLNLIPNMLFGDRAYGKWLDHERPCEWDECPYKKKYGESSLTPLLGQKQ